MTAEHTTIDPRADYRAAYSNYLVGRFAMTQGDVATASMRMDAAAAYDPSNANIFGRIFSVQLTKAF